MVERQDNLSKTVFSLDWYRDNEDKLRKILPTQWLYSDDFNIIKFGFDLKLLGVNWTETQHLGFILKLFHDIELLYDYKGIWIKANPNSCYDNLVKVAIQYSKKE